MKKWKIIRMITVVILIIFIIYLGYDAISCIKMKYPHPMLGIDAYNWIDQFTVDLVLSCVIFGVPMIIDIVLLIISILKIKKYKRN